MGERSEASVGNGSSSGSTLRRRLQSLNIGRSNSINRSKTSPDLKADRSNDSHGTSNEGIHHDSLDVFTQQRIPSTHEIAFYVGVEAVKELRDYWRAIVDTFVKQNSAIVEPDPSLGQHAQIVFNSTQSQYVRLEKVMEQVSKDRKPLTDSQMLPLNNFYQNEKHRFYELLQAESKGDRRSKYETVFLDSMTFHNPGLFSNYVVTDAVSSLELEGIFNGRLYQLPKCVFMLSNLEKLNLSYNNLRSLPADVGRLRKLKYLKLSHNRLKNDSIPYTLSFCTQLSTLLLDYNSLDAVPGFVLKLKNLKTLHRHGNQNYFRTTFMWYGCESRERIRTASFSDIDVAASSLRCATEVQSLQFWAAHRIIKLKTNYFLIKTISESMKDYMSSIYNMFNICAACKNARLLHEQGYFVFTFHNPYLGNTCVPFQHWTCSRECALSIEVPARERQIQMARKQQQQYENSVHSYSSSTHTSPIAEHPSHSPDLLCGSMSASRRPVRSRRHGRCKLM